MRDRESYIRLIGVVIAIAVVIVVVLALLSPQIGNIFSNITADLAAAPTVTPTRTASPTLNIPGPAWQVEVIPSSGPPGTVYEVRTTFDARCTFSTGEQLSGPFITAPAAPDYADGTVITITCEYRGEQRTGTFTVDTGNEGPVAQPGPNPTPPPGDDTCLVQTGGSFRVNVRDQPSFNSGIITVLQPGAQYEALTYSDNFQWIQVRAGMFVGWVSLSVTGVNDTQLCEDIGATVAEASTSQATATSTPTPQPTETAETIPTVEPPPPEPTEIGRGEITVENRDTVEQGDTVTVELVLGNIAWESFFDPPEEEGMDAAVEGARTINPPAMLAGGAVLPQTTPVTRMERVPVYPRMGAWIQCPADVLSGCDNELPGKLLPPITGRAEGFTWPAWILTASEDYAGILEDDVRIYVYYVADPDIAPDEITVENIRYIGDPIRVPLEVVAISQPPDIALIAGIALGVLTMGGVIAYAISQNRPLGSAYRGDPDRPQVFISYRRKISWPLARSVANSLQQRGADVFIDVDDINEGRFASTIEQAIETADYVVPVLAPGTLDSDWVRREIIHALAHDKVIIPLLADGFQLDANDLPDEIRDIASHNAITVLPEFYEEALDRLASRFLKLD